MSYAFHWLEVLVAQAAMARQAPGGSGGGGAILIASSISITVNGVISSSGAGYYCAGIASAGAIRLVAPVVAGSGTLDANGNYSNCRGGRAAGGRIRIDCLDRLLSEACRGEPTMAPAATRGSQMIVFPPNNPHLDIVQAAGQTIPVGTTNSVSFELPPGPDTNITVRVQATGFANNVPIRVVVTPENGGSGNFDAVIDLSLGNPGATNVTVTLPSGTVSTIHAWTR